MTLQINLGIKKERRLMKNLRQEHPSVRGNIQIIKGNKKVINKIIAGIPDFEKQAERMTKLPKVIKGGKR